MHHFRNQLINAFMFLEEALLIHCVIKVKCEFIWSHIVIIHMLVPYYKKDFNDLSIVINFQEYFGHIFGILVFQVQLVTCWYISDFLICTFEVYSQNSCKWSTIFLKSRTFNQFFSNSTNSFVARGQIFPSITINN